MNILYLEHNNYEVSFISLLEREEDITIIRKENLTNISVKSYDGFIISLNIFEDKTNTTIKTIESLYSLNKPILFIYSYIAIDHIGIKYIKENFAIDFYEIDCSIVDGLSSEYKLDCNLDNAVSMISHKGICQFFVKNTKNCFLVKMNNITILHDFYFRYNTFNVFDSHKYTPPTLENGNLLTSFIFDNSDISETPLWIENINFYNDNDLHKDFKLLDNKINMLLKEKQKIASKLDKNNYYKKILYSTGDELVSVIKDIILEMLKITPSDLDVKKEDLSFKLNDKKILVEIKGVNTPFKREHVSQIYRHILDNAQKDGISDEEIDTAYKGLLIINPYKKYELQDKISKEIYSNSVKKDIQYHNICALDTLTLLQLFSKFKEDNDSVDLKDIILNNNYISPNFNDILDTD